MKKFQVGILIGLVTVVGLVVLGNKHGFNRNKNTTPPIKIGIYAYPGYGTLYVAQEKGFFKKFGVNVELDQIPLDNQLPALASGEIQMLLGTSDGMAVIADAGIKAKQIFVTSKSNGADGLAVSNDIKTMQDLKGKKVYVTLGFPDHMFFRNLQKQAGLKLNDVELVNMDAELAASSFIAGKVNAAWTWEPYLSKIKERKDGHVLVTSKDAPNLMPEDNMMAREDLIAHRREDVKNVMRAFFEAETWWNNNVDEGNAIVAKAFKITPEEFAPTRTFVSFSNLQTNLEKFDPSKPWNVFEQAAMGAEVYFADGLIKTKTNGDAVTDASLLQELK